VGSSLKKLRLPAHQRADGRLEGPSNLDRAKFFSASGQPFSGEVATIDIDCARLSIAIVLKQKPKPKPKK
jgi:hypothetical protein